MRAAVLVLVVLGCSTDPGAEDPYSLVSVGGVCPGPHAMSASACPTLICDRGASNSGRFTTIESCAPGFNASRCGAMQSASSHPAFNTCRQGTRSPVWILRDTDVTAAVRQCQTDAGMRPEWCP